MISASTMMATPITCQNAEIPLMSDVMRTSNTLTNVAPIRTATNT